MSDPQPLPLNETMQRRIVTMATTLNTARKKATAYMEFIFDLLKDNFGEQFSKSKDAGEFKDRIGNAVFGLELICDSPPPPAPQMKA